MIHGDQTELYLIPLSNLEISPVIDISAISAVSPEGYDNMHLCASSVHTSAGGPCHKRSSHATNEAVILILVGRSCTLIGGG